MGEQTTPDVIAALQEDGLATEVTLKHAVFPVLYCGMVIS